ncbi:MAG: DUF1194 domain-containing protein [Alphaproteobacteria bacterium]|nr:DUF1194 domain-containing protein [Alphaproteobacteria bacterium]
MRGLFRLAAGLAAVQIAVAMGWFLAPSSAAQDVRPVDLELVLAVDISSSVDREEFDLQMRGIAEAFRQSAVVAAIEAAGQLGIAVAVVQWSDRHEQVLAVDWTHVDDEASALAIANRIGTTRRTLSGSQTAISGALEYSLQELESNGYEGVRRVIDISGDGRANAGSHPMAMRDLAVANGVVVNGLAILNEEPFVDSYYRYSVIGGEGAFLKTAIDYEDFAIAMLEKLIREIELPPVSDSVPFEDTPTTLHARR